MAALLDQCTFGPFWMGESITGGDWQCCCELHNISLVIFIFAALVAFIHSDGKTGNQGRERMGHAARGHRLGVEPATAAGGL